MKKSKTSILKFSLIVFLIGFCIPISYAGIEETKKILDDILKSGEKVTIIIIDMEEDLFPDFYKGEADYVIPQQEKLLTYAGEKGIPVINVVFANEDGTELGLNPILKNLKGLRYKNFYKLGKSAFEREWKFKQIDEKGFVKEIGEDHLSSFLEKGQKLFIAGCFDRGCVTRTVQEALEDGFEVYIDRDMNIMHSKDEPLENYEEFADEAWSELEDIYNKVEKRLHIPKKTKQKTPLCK